MLEVKLNVCPKVDFKSLKDTTEKSGEKINIALKECVKLTCHELGIKKEKSESPERDSGELQIGLPITGGSDDLPQSHIEPEARYCHVLSYQC